MRRYGASPRCAPPMRWPSVGEPMLLLGCVRCGPDAAATFAVVPWRTFFSPAFAAGLALAVALAGFTGPCDEEGPGGGFFVTGAACAATGARRRRAARKLWVRRR